MALKKRADSKFWWARFKVRGKPYFFSTHTESRRDALAYERAERAKLEKQAQSVKKVVAKTAHTLADVSALELARAERSNVDPHVIKTSYLLHWKHFLRFFGDCKPNSITEKRLDDYVDYRRPTARVQTIKKELRTLRRGLKLAYKAGWIEHVPVNWPEFAKNDTPSEKLRGKFREADVVGAWLALMDRPRAHDARDEALLVAMTALRWKEAGRLRPEYLQRMPAGFPVPAILRLPPEATKGKYERILGITAEALAVFERSLARREARMKRNVELGRVDDGTLFGPGDRGNTRERASAKLIAQGVTNHNVTLRDLRHSFATVSLSQDTDLKALMDSMGHKDLRVASLYQHSTMVRTAAAALNFGAAVSYEGVAVGVEQSKKQKHKSLTSKKKSRI